VALGAPDRDRAEGGQLLALAVELYHSGRSGVSGGCRVVAIGIPGTSSRDRPPTEKFSPSPPADYALKKGVSHVGLLAKSVEGVGC
jgi:hypothetical protein